MRQGESLPVVNVPGIVWVAVFAICRAFHPHADICMGTPLLRAGVWAQECAEATSSWRLRSTLRRSLFYGARRRLLQVKMGLAKWLLQQLVSKYGPIRKQRYDRLPARCQTALDNFVSVEPRVVDDRATPCLTLGTVCTRRRAGDAEATRANSKCTSLPSMAPAMLPQRRGDEPGWNGREGDARERLPP